jgi:hypothetical protein
MATTSKETPQELEKILKCRWVGGSRDNCQICEGKNMLLMKDSERAKLPTPYSVIAFTDGDFKTTDDLAIVASSDLTNLRDGVIHFSGLNVINLFLKNFLLTNHSFNDK